MDSSTLALHRSLLRLLKGSIKAYEVWIDEQHQNAMVDRLKLVRGATVSPSVDTTTGRGA